MVTVMDEIRAEALVHRNCSTRWEGIQLTVQGQRHACFTELETGSTTWLPIATLTPEALEAKVQEMRAGFAAWRRAA